MIQSSITLSGIGAAAAAWVGATAATAGGAAADGTATDSEVGTATGCLLQAADRRTTPQSRVNVFRIAESKPCFQPPVNSRARMDRATVQPR